MEHSWILMIAMLGHVLCVYADRLLLCTPGGQFSFPDMKDNRRMAKHFAAKPESEPLRSMPCSCSSSGTSRWGSGCVRIPPCVQIS